LLFLAQEETTGAHEVLKFTVALRQGLPGAGVFLGAEVGDEGGVNGVVLGADQAAVSVTAGAQGVDDADGVTALSCRCRASASP